MTLPWSRAALEQGSFTGFVPFADLPHADVPDAPGVYAVLRPSAEPPGFLPSSTAGVYRRREPAVPAEVLQQHWVDGAEVLYIGGTTSTRGLRARLDDYRRHGAGEPVAHWGGRYVWQLEDHAALLVAWNATHEPAAVVESRMLRDFRSHWGALPFANLRR